MAIARALDQAKLDQGFRLGRALGNPDEEMIEFNVHGDCGALGPRGHFAAVARRMADSSKTA